MIRDHSQQAERSKPLADLDTDQEATQAAAAAVALEGEPQAGTAESGQLFKGAFIRIRNGSWQLCICSRRFASPMQDLQHIVRCIVVFTADDCCWCSSHNRGQHCCTA